MSAPDWDALYAEQLPRVYNFFRYRVGDGAVAEDLASRTFEKAWVGRARFRRDLGGFGTWLLAIARNVAIDHYRARRVHEPIEAADAVPSGDAPDAEHERRETFARLGRLLEALPPGDRELVALKYGAGLPHRDIARLVGTSESNVGTRLHRTVLALRAQWTEAP